MRLREKNSDKLTKVYHNKKLMDHYNIFEGKQLAFQMISEMEDPKEEEFLVMLQFWDPDKWTLTPVKELYVEKSCTLALFAGLISSIYDIPVTLQLDVIGEQYNVLQNSQCLVIFTYPTPTRIMVQIRRE